MKPHADRIYVVTAAGAAIRRPGTDLRLQASARALNTHDDMTMEQRNAAAPQLHQIVAATQGQCGRARHHLGKSRGRPKAWPVRKFHYCGDLHPGPRQLEGNLQVEWAVAGDQYAPPRQHGIAAQQRLRRAGRHHARKSPAGKGQATLIGACRHDQPLRPAEAARRPIEDHEIEWLERAPQLCAPEERNAGSLCRGDQRAPAGELRIVGERGTPDDIQRPLIVLAARLRPLVDQQHAGARPRCGRRRVQPAGPASEHEHIGRQDFFIPDRLLCHRRKIDSGRKMGLAPHRARPVEFGHAGAQIAAAIDLDETFLADAHAAEEPAPLACLRFPQFPFAGGGERRHQGFAGAAANRVSMKIHRDGIRAERRALHTQGVGHGRHRALPLTARHSNANRGRWPISGRRWERLLFSRARSLW
jgi:hypothetical protein